MIVFRDVFNQYSNELFKILGQTIPHDHHEIILKLVPLSKIESKFTEILCDKILLITDKKIIELNSEFVDSAKVVIIPYNKLKKLCLFSKNHKIQFYTEDDILYQYSTLYAKFIFELILFSHRKECLSELQVVKN